jgi:hypothetical protein
MLDPVVHMLNRAAILQDEHDIDALASLFTKDANMSVSVAGEAVAEWHGLEEILRVFRYAKRTAADQRRHVVTNYVFEEQRADSFGVRSYLTLLTVNPAGEVSVGTCGWYRDEVILDDDAWKIRRRHLALDRPFI